MLILPLIGRTVSGAPPPQRGEVLPLKVMTYSALSASLVTLLITFLLLLLLPGLRSSLHAVRRHLVAALFLGQLLFLCGIDQTDNTVTHS